MESLDQWQRRGARFSFRGHSVFAIDSSEAGDAAGASDAGEAGETKAADAREALLLIHGFPTSSHDWCELWPALTRRFRCLTLDMLGFGLSAKPWPHAYSIVEQADLFTAYLASKGITSAHLLAHDYGVTVAQELVARHVAASADRAVSPDRAVGSAPADRAAGVTNSDRATSSAPADRATSPDRAAGAPLAIRSVCLLNGGILPELHRPFRIQRLLASRLGPLVARLTSFRAFAANMRRLWGRRPISDEDLRQLWSAAARDRGTRVMPGLIGYMAERRLHRDRWVGALEALDAPLTVIIGMDDPISGAHVAAGCREVFPQAIVVDLPGVGHYPQLEAPDEVRAALPWQVAAAPPP